MRWRDTKKGKNKQKTKMDKNSPVISPIRDRFKAFVTDSFMIFMPICYVVIYAIMGSREGFRSHMLLGWFYILIPHFIIITLFLFFKGQTPGYKAYDIKLVNLKSQGPTLFQIISRYITFTLSILFFPVLFIAYFRKDTKGLCDIISGTLPLHIKEN